MSSEDSATYSDAQNGHNLSGDTSPVRSSSSSSEAPRPRRVPSPKHSYASGDSIFRHSESLFLVLLFALIALLLPAFFFYASGPSKGPSPAESDSGSADLESRKSPLTALLAHIPAFSTLFRLSFFMSYTLFRPFIALFSVFLALVAPIFIAGNLLFKAMVIVPASIVTELIQFFYPLYLFCGTACVLGGVVGLGGKLLVEGGRFMLSKFPDQDLDEMNVQRVKRQYR